MGDLMAYPRKPRRGAALYDTPTDGISKKVFDRYKDRQVRKQVVWQERIRELELLVAQLFNAGGSKEEE